MHHPIPNPIPNPNSDYHDITISITPTPPPKPNPQILQLLLKTPSNHHHLTSKPHINLNQITHPSIALRHLHTHLLIIERSTPQSILKNQHHLTHQLNNHDENSSLTLFTYHTPTMRPSTRKLITSPHLTSHQLLLTSHELNHPHINWTMNLQSV
ncbi:hypothetical protein M758_9G116500 [Ceratodon purpureus]|nr:hypothetical protein M758_9G116500 [Ceratodon purpureus]